MNTIFYNGRPYRQCGLFGKLFEWPQKFGTYLKTMIIVT